MKKIFLQGTILLAVLLFGCSTSRETSSIEGSEEPDLYVFDDVEKVDSIEIKKTEKPVDDSTKITPDIINIVKEDTVKSIKEELVSYNQNKIDLKIAGYAVQLGAFSSRERAEDFIKENQSKTIYHLNISSKPSTNLFVVQTSPVYAREEADAIRNMLRKNSIFKDAFVVSD
jgi:cell division septation protein DedD